MRSSFYTLKLWRREAFTQRGLLRTEVFTRKLYTEKLWHREASKQSIFYTQKHLHAQKLYIHTELLHTDAFTHRSLFTELTDRRFDAERPVYRAAFTHRRFYTEMHRDTQSSFCTQTPPGFYAQKFLHISFTQRSLYTEHLLYTEAFTRKSFTHTQKLYTHAWAFTHRRFYA